MSKRPHLSKNIAREYALPATGMKCELHGNHPATLEPWLVAPYATCDLTNLERYEYEWETSPALQEIPLREYLKMMGILKYPDPSLEKAISNLPEFKVEACRHVSTMEEFLSLPVMDTLPCGLIRYRFCPDCDRIIKALVTR